MLLLEKAKIPPVAMFKEVNPAIDLQSSHLEVNSGSLSPFPPFPSPPFFDEDRSGETFFARSVPNQAPRFQPRSSPGLAKGCEEPPSTRSGSEEQTPMSFWTTRVTTFTSTA